MAKGKVFYVGSDGRFILPSDRTVDTDRAVSAAQSFTLSLESLRVVHDYGDSVFKDLTKKSGNDLLVKSTVSLGARPKIDVIHFYEDDVPPGEPRSGFEYKVIYACDDFKDERLWLFFQIWEIDIHPKGANIADSIISLAKVAGTAFPIMAPYAAAAGGVSKTIDWLRSQFTGNDRSILTTIDFMPLSRLKDSNCGNLLRFGTYVFFKSDTEGDRFILQGNRVFTKDGQADPDDDYAVLTLEPGHYEERKAVISQEIAETLTLMENHRTGAGDTSAALDAITSMIQAQERFQSVERYNELSAKGDKLTAPEKELLAKIKSREDLKGYLK